MRDPAETAEESLDPASLDCLKKTRSGVLNVLVGVGAVVALSGALLRRRADDVVVPVPDLLNQVLFLCLILIFVVSTVTRRVLGRRARLRDPHLRGPRFFWGHVVPAAIGALAAPLGLLYGWLVSPRIEVILPFWLAALVLGVLAYPRGRELRGSGCAHGTARKAGAMTPAQTTILLIYGAIIAAWPIRYLVLKYILSKTQFLSPGSPTLDAADPPLVSAVIPAKDEEATLADCLASVCLQAYPRLEILVIDDRSVDRTRQIANEFAARDARLRVLSNDHLPPGWTGKTYVLQQAADQARGQWLWFLDADTVHAPEFLGVTLEYARAQQAALVSLLPELRCETFWEQVVQPLGESCSCNRSPCTGSTMTGRSWPSPTGNRSLSSGKPTMPPGATRPFATDSSRTSAWRARSRPWGCRSARSWCETSSHAGCMPPSVSSSGAGAGSFMTRWTARPGGLPVGCSIPSSSARAGMLPSWPA